MYGLDLIAQRDGFIAAREYSASLGQQLFVVVTPARERHFEQSLPFFETAFWVRVGIQEDM